ncbi:MAG: tRNA (adenosine(37)-N6)-threonylcarbamoyltransferase complex ATPase subunit type 1 TsaE [Chloroflexi bacterium]|nr:tRNA (adenosine(37)-N6)-threonylcarbamoyltransferase complex ATPase subunit type 1 TsaE [Chloroflexota bacterium]
MDEHSLDFISHSEAQTRRLGARLGELLQSGDVICLAGELGAGKTCLAQGIGQGLGIEGPITSPSFTLINEYRPEQARLPFYHIDLYRIEEAKETLSLGLEEYFYGEGACVVEWADRALQALPAEHLWIELRYIVETKRGLLMKALGKRYEQLLREFKRMAFGI